MSDFLVTTWDEWYFVQIIFGLEFAIKLSGPEIDGYLKWLKDNNNESWFYMANNSVSILSRSAPKRHESLPVICQRPAQSTFRAIGTTLCTLLR